MSLHLQGEGEVQEQGAMGPHKEGKFCQLSSNYSSMNISSLDEIYYQKHQGPMLLLHFCVYLISAFSFHLQYLEFLAAIAALYVVMSVGLSVCPSVCRSVCRSVREQRVSRSLKLV